MEPHTKALSSSCFHHIRSFKQIRSSLDDGMAVSVASALVSSRLDQVNSILYGAASKHTNRLQRVQNALATWQESLPISVHTLLHSHPLHYSKTSIGFLPIEWRVHFKPATLAYKALHTGQPPYLVRTVTTLWTHTDSAIFLFFSTLCSTTQSWIWLARISNLSTKNLELIAC